MPRDAHSIGAVQPWMGTPQEGTPLGTTSQRGVTSAPGLRQVAGMPSPWKTSGLMGKKRRKRRAGKGKEREGGEHDQLGENCVATELCYTVMIIVTC